MNMKDEILVKSAEIISQEGLDSFTMARLSDVLGIKKASLYYYYESKEEIILKMHDYFHSLLLKNGYKIELSEDAEKNLSSLVEHWEDLFFSKDFYDYLRTLLILRQNDERAYEEWRSLSLTIEGQSRIIIEKITNKAEIAAPLFASLLELRLEEALLSNESGSLERLPQSFISFLH